MVRAGTTYEERVKIRADMKSCARYAFDLILAALRRLGFDPGVTPP
jgi:hypothetical protein